MSQDTPDLPVHPAGEQPPIEQNAALAPATLSTWAGPVRVEWDPTAPLTPYGQLPFFIEFLKVAGLFDALVADCPLAYTSPNAPDKRDVLGTTMLSILAGHKRYAHITALRNDGVLPELLGMEKIVSEDAVRRAFKVIGDNEGKEWLQGHLDYCTAPLLAEPWAMDTDSTIKPLYGHQEGAVLGYNPKKPGRPSHVYHTYTLAGLRLVLDVDVAPGNEHASKHAGAGLWALLDRIPRDCRPAFLRGDSGFGTEAVMSGAEQRGLPYLFKLRLTANVKKLIKKTFYKGEWTDAGQGWQGREDTLRLEGWSRQRWVVILRRRLKEGLTIARRGRENQMALGFVEIGPGAEAYEYGVLVTSLEEEVLTLAQLYRDRADSENPFDELKNTIPLLNGAGLASPPAICLAANSWPALSRSSTTGGTCLCALPNQANIWRPSPAGRCCCPPSQSAAVMHARPRCVWPALTPRPVGPRACSLTSPASFASLLKMRSS